MTPEGKFERYEGSLAVYVMGHTMQGNMSASVPALSEPGTPVALPRSDKVPVLYDLADHEFVLGVIPPSRAYRPTTWEDLTRTLNSRLWTRPGTGIYAALSLGVTLLFLAAAQALIIVRTGSAANAVGDVRHLEPRTPAQDPRPGAIRSFAGRLYSLVFESREREEPTGPYRQ